VTDAEDVDVELRYEFPVPRERIVVPEDLAEAADVEVVDQGGETSVTFSWGTGTAGVPEIVENPAALIKGTVDEAGGEP